MFPSACSLVFKCSVAFGAPRRDLCGVFGSTYLSSFNLSLVTLTFKASGEDREAIPPGDYQFVISGFLGAILSADSIFTLTLIDPCTLSSKVTALWDPQIDPDTYYYNGEMLITLSRPVVTPSFCAVSYSCSVEPALPQNDLCDVNVAGLVGKFDSDDVTYSYSYSDKNLAQPGEY